jgi:hypothetical protein
LVEGFAKELDIDESFLNRLGRSSEGFAATRLDYTPAELLCYHMYFTFVPPEALHVSTRTGAGLLRSTWRELLLDARAVFLPTIDFFSMTLLLVEGVSPPPLTKAQPPWKKGQQNIGFTSAETKRAS